MSIKNIEKDLILEVRNKTLIFSLYEMPFGKRLISGYIDGIGNLWSNYVVKNVNNYYKRVETYNYYQAFNFIINEMLKNDLIKDISEIKKVCYHLNYGGEKYQETTIINDEFIGYYEDLTNQEMVQKEGLEMIKIVKDYLPNATLLASFDASFYQKDIACYVPSKILNNGFHGISNLYIMEKMQRFLGRKDVNLIICHLNELSSVCCIKEGIKAIPTMTNKKYQDEDYAKDIALYINKFYFEFPGRLDAIVFTGYNGVNDSFLRNSIIKQVGNSLNIKLRDEVNDKIGYGKTSRCGVISRDDSNALILVIPSNEDYVILKDAMNINKKDDEYQKVKKI